MLPRDATGEGLPLQVARIAHVRRVTHQRGCCVTIGKRRVPTVGSCALRWIQRADLEGSIKEGSQPGAHHGPARRQRNRQPPVVRGSPATGIGEPNLVGELLGEAPLHLAPRTSRRHDSTAIVPSWKKRCYRVPSVLGETVPAVATACRFVRPTFPCAAATHMP